ncbi:MAG: repressor LexA [Bryobacterales bacterium]|nr:repressor LexA [Bryobacterales bacterium]
MTLTRRQREIYDYILTFRRDHGCSPSIPELQKAFAIRSPNGVAGHLNALIAKGMLRRAQRGSRNIDPAAPSQPVYTLPLSGSIAAGMPETISGAFAEGACRADAALLGFVPKPGCFALRVRGGSMNGSGILDGDTVIVEPDVPPRENQIVVALIDGESALKRLVRVEDRYFLKAGNPAYPELHPLEGLVIQGVVRTVIRHIE